MSSFSKRVSLNLIDSTQISNPPPHFILRLIFAIKRIIIFFYRFEMYKPDAILLFMAGSASVAEKGVMARYAKFRGTPILIFPRAGLLINKFQKSYLSRINIFFGMKSATKILCQGQTFQSFLINQLDINEKDAPIISSWTATTELLEIGKKRVSRKNKKKVRLLFIGWLDEEKGVLDLIEACFKLIQKREFSLEFIGEGNVSSLAREKVKRYNLVDCIRFRGWLHGQNLAQVLKNSDVFVLPSWTEGLPNAMIEAMAAKLAVIVTSVGNIPDVIQDGVNGLLIPPRNMKQLENALARVIDNAELRNNLAFQGYNLAASSFNVETAVDRIVNIIDEVTKD